MKKKALAAVVLVFTLVALLAQGILPGAVAGAAGASTGEIGFYVRAVLPQNQLDSSLTYFDLRVEPDSTQTLEVEVVNETNEAIAVDIEAISASTNRNGVIDYKTPGIRDITLRYPFSQLTQLESGTLEVPGRGTATARITITMPDSVYDGVVLGGLVFTRLPGGSTGEGGMTLQNVYSYVVGVKLSETDAVVLPAFELDSIRGETVNYGPALVHSIRNAAAAIAKGADISVTVRDSSGRVVAELERKGVDMAPNSIMPLAVTLIPQEGGTSPGELLPGDYTSDVTLEHGGQTHVFTQQFTIGSVEADDVNSQTVGGAHGSAPEPDPLLITLLVAAVAIIAALVIIIVLLARRRKDDREPDEPALADLKRRQQQRDRERRDLHYRP